MRAGRTPARARTLLFVGIAVAVVALAIAALEVAPRLASRSAPVAPSVEGQEQSVPICVLDPGRIRKIELASPAGEVTLELERGAWRIASPIEAAAKAEAMEGLLETFSALYSERVIEEQPADLAPYGLAPPAAVGQATLADGSTRRLLLGDRTPAGTTFYLMTEDDPRVFAVWMSHADRLGATLDDLLEPRPLLAIDPKYLTGVRILKNGRPAIEVATTPDLVRSDVEMRSSYLSITVPYTRPKPVDSFLITESFLNPLSALSIEGVADPAPRDLARYGLDRPAYEVSLKDDRTSTTFQIGAVDGDRVYVRIPGERPVYTAPGALADLVARQEPFDWLERFAAIVAMKSVVQATLAAVGRTHTLGITRVGSGETASEIYAVDGQVADARGFKALWQQMASIEVDAVTDEPVADRAPDLLITYRLLSGAVREYRVAFVPHGTDFYAVVKNGEASGLLVNRGQVRALLEAADALAADPSGAAATP